MGCRNRRLLRRCGVSIHSGTNCSQQSRLALSNCLLNESTLRGPKARRAEKRPFADGTNVTTAPVRHHVDNAPLKAIARAFRWREMLETGTHATIAEIA